MTELPEHRASRQPDEGSARWGYWQAVVVLRGVAQRTGSPAARWAADYLESDPGRQAPTEFDQNAVEARVRVELAEEIEQLRVQRDWLLAEAPDEVRGRYFSVKARIAREHGSRQPDGGS